MRKMNLFISTLIVLALITSVSLFAKGDKCKSKKGKCSYEKPEMTQGKADLLNRLKNDFDSKLNEDDLTTLNSLREKVKESRLDMKLKFKELKALNLDKDEMKSKISVLKEQSKESREEIKIALKTIFENNQDAVKSLVNELHVLKDKSKHKERVSKKYNKHEDKHRLARFVLQDEFIAHENNINDIVNNSTKLDISINHDILTFESKKESNNSTYKLYDLTGNKISSVSNQSLLEGENTLNLNIFDKNIEKGRYFLVIENENGLSAGKFIYIK